MFLHFRCTCGFQHKHFKKLKFEIKIHSKLQKEYRDISDRRLLSKTHEELLKFIYLSACHPTLLDLFYPSPFISPIRFSTSTHHHPHNHHIVVHIPKVFSSFFAQTLHASRIILTTQKDKPTKNEGQRFQTDISPEDIYMDGQ